MLVAELKVCNCVLSLRVQKVKTCCKHHVWVKGATAETLLSITSTTPLSSAPPDSTIPRTFPTCLSSADMYVSDCQTRCINVQRPVRLTASVLLCRIDPGCKRQTDEALNHPRDKLYTSCRKFAARTRGPVANRHIFDGRGIQLQQDFSW